MPDVTAVLSYPFRLRPNGTPATVEQDTPDQYAELLGALVLTRVGERDLVPGFGIPDPAFVGLDMAALEAASSIFGPGVRILNVEIAVTGVNTQDVRVEFE